MLPVNPKPNIIFSKTSKQRFQLDRHIGLLSSSRIFPLALRLQHCNNKPNIDISAKKDITQFCVPILRANRPTFASLSPVQGRIG